MTKLDLLSVCTAIKGETQRGANTASRIGQLLVNIVNALPLYVDDIIAYDKSYEGMSFHYEGALDAAGATLVQYLINFDEANKQLIVWNGMPLINFEITNQGVLKMTFLKVYDLTVGEYSKFLQVTITVEGNSVGSTVSVNGIANELKT